MAPNHGGDTLGSILGPMGSHWVQKMGQSHKKLPCPKFRIFDYPAYIDFSQKMEVTIMAPNYGGYPLRSILGPMGYHLVKKKWVKTVKNYHAPKFEFSTTPRSLIFRKKWKLRLWRQITVETPYGPSWGQWGPIGSKKWVKTVKKLPCLEIRIFDYNNFSQKMEVTVMAPNYGGYTLWSIMGPMGSHWVKKMGQSHKKIPRPKLRIFDYPAVSDFHKKWKLRLWRQITVGTPQGPSCGQSGPIESKKWVKAIKKYDAPISNFPLPRGHRFFTKNGKYGYGAKSRWGPPRVHLGVNGDPLGPKNGSKP